MNEEMEEYIKTIFATSILLTRKWEVIVNRLYTSKDLTLKQLMLLIVLENNFSENPTIKQVSSVLATSHQNVKAIVLQLERKGFVKLYQDSEDKRYLRIEVCNDKSEYWEQRKQKDDEILMNLFSGIPLKDLITTSKVILTLDKIAKNKLDF